VVRCALGALMRCSSVCLHSGLKGLGLIVEKPVRVVIEAARTGWLGQLTYNYEAA
jgi:ribosomal protein S5